MAGVKDRDMDQHEKNIHTDGLLTVQQFAALVGKSPQSIYKRLNKVDNLFNPVVNLNAKSCQPHSTRLNNLFNPLQLKNQLMKLLF